MIAEIILNSSAKGLNKIFDYNIPSNIEGIIHIGSRVFVPFGYSKKLEEGFVVGLKDSTEYKVKDIEKIEESMLAEENIDLAKIMAKRYFCNIFDCIKLMLPPGMATKNYENRAKEKILNCVYLLKDYEEIEFEIEDGKIKSDKQIRLLNILKDNEGITVSDLEMISDVKVGVMKTLEKNGYIKFQEEAIERNPFEGKEIKKDEPLKLTKEQEEAYNKIGKNVEENKFGEYLIYGVTGSRKNRNISTINTKSYREK